LSVIFQSLIFQTPSFLCPGHFQVVHFQRPSLQAYHPTLFVVVCRNKTMNC